MEGKLCPGRKSFGNREALLFFDKNLVFFDSTLLSKSILFANGLSLSEQPMMEPSSYLDTVDFSGVVLSPTGNIIIVHLKEETDGGVTAYEFKAATAEEAQSWVEVLTSGAPTGFSLPHDSVLLQGALSIQTETGFSLDGSRWGPKKQLYCVIYAFVAHLYDGPNGTPRGSVDLIGLRMVRQGLPDCALMLELQTTDGHSFAVTQSREGPSIEEWHTGFLKGIGGKGIAAPPVKPHLSQRRASLGPSGMFETENLLEFLCEDNATTAGESEMPSTNDQPLTKSSSGVIRSPRRKQPGISASSSWNGTPELLKKAAARLLPAATSPEPKAEGGMEALIQQMDARIANTVETVTGAPPPGHFKVGPRKQSVVGRDRALGRSSESSPKIDAKLGPIPKAGSPEVVKTTVYKGGGGGGGSAGAVNPPVVVRPKSSGAVGGNAKHKSKQTGTVAAALAFRARQEVNPPSLAGSWRDDDDSAGVSSLAGTWRDEDDILLTANASSDETLRTLTLRGDEYTI